MSCAERSCDAGAPTILQTRGGFVLEAWMTMRRHVLVALTVLGLAGCASTTPTSDTPLKRGGAAIDPAALRPDLGDDVSGGVRTRGPNSGLPGGRVTAGCPGQVPPRPAPRGA